MSLRARILLASALVLLIPLAVLSIGIRREMAHRLTDQYTRQVQSLAAVIEDDLPRCSRDLGDRLAALKTEMAADNRLRLAAAGGDLREKGYLLDYAHRAMGMMGLSMLQIQDAAGRIMSSGHFRNEFGRLEPALPRLLAAAPGGTALVSARRPEGPFLAMARIDSISFGAKRFTLIGGFSVDRSFLTQLARDPDLAVSLLYPGGALSSDPVIEEALPKLREHKGELLQELPMGDFVFRGIDLAAAMPDAAPAQLIVSHSRASLRDILRRLDRWFALVLIATAAASLILAVGFSLAISRPIHALARKTAGIDLDHLDADFSSTRPDEVGVLSRFLAAMTQRLQRDRTELRDAERRATVGELARQVNHDLRNGLVPIQNVLRHLGQVARETPTNLTAVFLERKATLESSLAYLEDLAANYARLSPDLKREPVNLSDIVRQVVPAGWPGGGVTVELDLADPLPPVLGDPTALRRIVENLVRNARESLRDGAGTVSIRTQAAAGVTREPIVVLTVSDSGGGIPARDLDRIFERFYSTKPGSTGMGLSIVQRLVSDHEGNVCVESTPGHGTRFTVSFPAMGK